MEIDIINMVFQSFNLSYNDVEIELVKRFSKTFNKNIKHSSLFLGRCFDKLTDDNIRRLREYGILNENDKLWLKNLDSHGRYKFVIECLNSQLRK